jgi:hypothetical protein
VRRSLPSAYYRVSAGRLTARRSCGKGIATDWAFQPRATPLPKDLFSQFVNETFSRDPPPFPRVGRSCDV